jgi:ribosome maturation protein Sdo1
VKVKAMRFAAKGKRFDLDNIKSFEDIYRDVESGCAMLKDMDDLV